MIWEYTWPETRLIQPAWHEAGSIPITIMLLKLSSKIIMKKSPSEQGGSFYFSPSCDVLLLSVDYTSGYYTDYVMYYSNELKRLYNGQLNYIKAVLVLHRKWVETTPAGYVKFLDIFGIG
jgi:hypothetical protein